MNLLKSLLLLTTFVVVTRSETFNCGEKTVLSSNEGILHIDRNVSNCEFLSLANTSFLAIKTDGLSLKLGDSVRVVTEAAKPGDPIIYEAPIHNGYYIIGIEYPRLVFHFNNTNNESMEAEFIQSPASNKLTINGDVASTFSILASNFSHTLDLVFTKTLVEPLLVSIVNGKFSDSELRYKLVYKDGDMLTVDLGDKKVASLVVEPLTTNCSNSFTDSTDSSHDLVGPSTIPAAAYKCVYLFKNNASSQYSHYDVNFKDYLDLTDVQDQLTIESGSIEDSTYITRGANYAKQIKTYQGRELAVIYSSPGLVQPTKLPFKMTVESKLYGGIVRPSSNSSTPIVFPSKGQVRYVVRSQPQEYAGVNILSNATKSGDLKLRISKGSEVLATFTSTPFLPPTVTASKPNEDLVLEFTGSDLSWLRVNATSSVKNCNQIGGSRLSVSGVRECSWVLTQTDLVGLEVKYFKDSCLTIQPLDQGTPVYNGCVNSLQKTLPVFNLGSAVVRVKLLKGTSIFDASLVASSYLELKNSQTNYTITSLRYPQSNEWSSQKEVLQLDARNKSYVLSVADLDLRDNEKVYLNNSLLRTGDELGLFNITANLTLTRTSSSKDFEFHRGINIVVTQFDRLLNTSFAAKTIKTPKNITSFYLRLVNTGNRIRYNISAIDSKFVNISVFDGTTILCKSSNNFNGSSTAETLTIVGRTTKLNFTLPELTINFDSIARNKSDLLCDNNIRSVPLTMLCQGIQHCDDGSDLKVSCSSAGPINPPKIIETGVASFTVFILCVLMLILGACSALYGPDLYKVLESRFRNGQYTSFTSTE